MKPIIWTKKFFYCLLICQGQYIYHDLGNNRDDLYVFQRLPDQFAPYKGIFDCSEISFQKGYFPGTLFRFPLRDEPSELSSTSYDSRKVEELFHSFTADAHLLLVFLKSVEAVELYRRTVDQTKEEIQFRVNVAPSCLDEVREKRKNFLSQIDPEKWMDRPISVNYYLVLETANYTRGTVSSRRDYRYLVTEYYGGGSASIQLKTLQKDTAFSHIPLVGVAMEIKDLKSEEKAEVSERGDEHLNGNDDVTTGHVFCFLPLPIEQKSTTGLPVHVNGYFSVSQNRRHIKWPTAGQTVRSEKALLWNACLLHELLPKCYVQLVLSAIQFCQANPHLVTPQHVMKGIPNLLSVDEKWTGLLEPFFTELFKLNVFFTKSVGDETTYGQRHLSTFKGRWIKLADSVFDCMKETAECKEVVKQVLIDAGVKVVEVPMYVIHALGSYGSYSPETITPTLIRGAVRFHPDTYRKLSISERLLLLGYILKDEDFPDLEGIQMLPLANGQFDIFTKRPAASTVYIPSDDHPRSLLPGMERHLVMDNLDKVVVEKLKKLAIEGREMLHCPEIFIFEKVINILKYLCLNCR